ncbi:hypothetical protein DH2020_011291 [Rehmannia glutinosa]|uniref:Uncharacterized protein n=1 Tax=Rehmannia glutinosa TaxID=99300 RepID=A0ABR0XCW7_REHGL
MTNRSESSGSRLGGSVASKEGVLRGKVRVGKEKGEKELGDVGELAIQERIRRKTKAFNASLTKSSLSSHGAPRYSMIKVWLSRNGFEPSINKSLHSSSSAAPFSKCPPELDRRNSNSKDGINSHELRLRQLIGSDSPSGNQPNPAHPIPFRSTTWRYG